LKLSQEKQLEKSVKEEERYNGEKKIIRNRRTKAIKQEQNGEGTRR
jgi:hypothetical protein